MRDWIFEQSVREEMEKKQLKLFTMDVKEYQEIIKKTAVFPKEIGLTYCTMGLCGEAGEVANKVKKIYRDKQGILSKEDSEKIADEMGDCLWYITALAQELGYSLEELFEINFTKLMERRRTNTLHGSGDDRHKI